MALQFRYAFRIDHKPRDWGLARSAYSIKYGKGGNKFGADFRIPKTQMELNEIAWFPFGRRAVRQRGYGLRLLIFKMANNKVDLGQEEAKKSFTVDS